MNWRPDLLYQKEHPLPVGEQPLESQSDVGEGPDSTDDRREDDSMGPLEFDPGKGAPVDAKKDKADDSDEFG